MDLNDGSGGGDGGQGGGQGGSAADVFAGGDGGGQGGGGEGQQQQQQGGEGQGGEGAQGGGQGGDQGGAADPDWYNQVSADLPEGEKASLRDWLKSTGVKDLNGLAKVARDNQAALRDSGRVKVPGEGASADEVKAFHKALGVPDDPKGYTFEPPKGADGAPVKMNDQALASLASVAQKTGVTPAAYQAMIADYAQFELTALAEHEAGIQAEADAKLKEWGEKRTANLAAINAGAAALGLEAKEVKAIRDAIGAGRAMDVFLKLGQGVAEDVILNPGGGGQRFGISASEAQEQIKTMRADKETMDKVFVKNSPERQRYDRLQAIIGQEADRKAVQG